jgi:cardiolipin synthase
LVNRAQHAVILTVENLGDPAFLTALATAAQRGVTVRVIVPMCDKNPNPLYNYQFLTKLASVGVQARVMPSPATPTTPYMHGKMITVDGHVSYIGSVNFSINSMEHARELGIVLSNADVVTNIEKVFEQDWAVSVSSSLPPNECPKFN